MVQGSDGARGGEACRSLSGCAGYGRIGQEVGRGEKWQGREEREGTSADVEAKDMCVGGRPPELSFGLCDCCLHGSIGLQEEAEELCMVPTGKKQLSRTIS